MATVPTSQTGNPNDPQYLAASGGNVELGANNSRTVIQKDPWQDFLYNTILQGSTNKNAYVPDYTQAALKQFTENPATPAQYFPQLAEPLLNAYRNSTEKTQTSNLLDLFRKAGGTGGGALQSGAFAQAGRQLVADQGQQEQALLAQEYNPLVGQLSTNTNNAIEAGLKFPQAQNTAISNLIPLATSLKPTQTDTNVLTAGTSAGAIPQTPAAPSWLNQGSTYTPPQPIYLNY